MKSLHIINCSFNEELAGLVPNSGALLNLESLSLHGNQRVMSFSQIANALGATFPKLRSLHLVQNPNMKNVFSSDYPHMVLPELEQIFVHYCGNMTEVLLDGSAGTQAFAPKLKSLYLSDLRIMQSLCNYKSSEQWQSLEILRVERCPNLKWLPHMTSIKEIKGTEEWLNKLHWDSPETKSNMDQFFKPWINEFHGLQFAECLSEIDDSIS